MSNGWRSWSLVTTLGKRWQTVPDARSQGCDWRIAGVLSCLGYPQRAFVVAIQLTQAIGKGVVQACSLQGRYRAAMTGGKMGGIIKIVEFVRVGSVKAAVAVKRDITTVKCILSLIRIFDEIIESCFGHPVHRVNARVIVWGSGGQ